MKNRMREYVEYHLNGDADCNTIILRGYADKKGLNLQQRFDLAYLFAICYCIPSALLMLNEKENILKDVKGWSNHNKEIIIFQSDRKYVKLLNRFEGCLQYYKDNLTDVNQFLQKVQHNGIFDIEKALLQVQSWFYFGRFASYLFIETFTALIDCKIQNTTIDWPHGDTATSGIMNLFGLDRSADYFDKTGRITGNLNKTMLDNMLNLVIKEIRASGGNDNVTDIETSLCAYRKFWKGTRYDGYYIDRMLEEILQCKKLSEKYGIICKELIELRKEKFDNKKLGEICGWNGIRKENKKLWIKTHKRLEE